MRIARPSRTIDVKILGLEASIQPREVAVAIAEAGGCEASEVKIGVLKRRSQRYSLAAWAQCPAQAAKKLVEKGKFRVGWISARVEALKSRLLVCFKCMEGWHAAKDCRSEGGSAELCFNCGRPGHKAKSCTTRPKCLVCEKAGRKADHRFGGRACTSPPFSSGRKPVPEKEGTTSKEPMAVSPKSEATRREKAAETGEGITTGTGDDVATPHHSWVPDLGEGTSRNA